jgi:hypothetical protein
MEARMQEAASMIEPEAPQYRRHRLEQRTKRRAHDWQEIGYQKEIYDGHAEEE